MSTIPSRHEFISKLKHYLTPPGEGVFTVHTASDKRIHLQNKMYGPDAVKENKVREIWEESLSKTLPLSKCVIFGIPSDCGGGIQRGANWGPLYLRESLINGREDLRAYDVGDVRVVPQLLHDKYLNEETIKKVRQSLYQSETINLPVSPLSIAYDFATSFHQQFPTKSIFMIGGDHSVSYPMVRAYLEAKKAQGKKVALIHFDAHTDLLDERMGIDICFGTWTSQIIPFLESPSHLVQIGIRASGKERGHWEKKFGHVQYWASEVFAKGPDSVADEIVTHLKKLEVEEIYVSFDIDCLDASYAGATGTPETGGLSPHEPMVIMQTLFENFKITGSDIVEIAPMVKPPQIKQIEPETTLLVANALSTFLIQAMGIEN
ncbi:MAG: arginase family protein [Bacteriovorax sp.]|nr:arginase family protein [Bacteriovorax sp.]